MKRSKKTWLWELSAESLPGNSYLFGTIHIRDNRAFVFLEDALNYLAECNVLATEFNLDEAESFSDSNSLDMPADFSLEEQLGKKKMARLEKLFSDQIGMPLASFQNMHPFVISSLLTESLMSRDMPLSLDQTIWYSAKNLGLQLIGLETFAFQMNLVNELSLSAQIQMLKQMLRNFKSFRKKQNSLVDLYSKAELGAIHKLASKQAGKFRRKLLYNRNFFMADSIFDLIKNDTHFFAVGGGHLTGQKGLLRLLKQKGITVRPVLLSEKSSDSFENVNYA